jgi:hypothetical protein
MNDQLSRRDFVRATVVLPQATAAGQVGQTIVTAGEVVNRIKQNVGVPWRSVTVDQIIAGDGPHACAESPR